MSGYNQNTGIFEITSTKAKYWLRRDAPPDIEEQGTMAVCKYLFTQAGFEVLKQGSGYIRVRATPEQVWETLSGKSSDPERAKNYYANERR
jgi:hypothetical protein